MTKIEFTPFPLEDFANSKASLSGFFPVLYLGHARAYDNLSVAARCFPFFKGFLKISFIELFVTFRAIFGWIIMIHDMVNFDRNQITSSKTWKNLYMESPFLFISIRTLHIYF